MLEPCQVWSLDCGVWHTQVLSWMSVLKGSHSLCSGTREGACKVCDGWAPTVWEGYVKHYRPYNYKQGRQIYNSATPANKVKLRSVKSSTTASKSPVKLVTVTDPRSSKKVTGPWNIIIGPWSSDLRSMSTGFIKIKFLLRLHLCCFAQRIKRRCDINVILRF